MFQIPNAVFDASQIPNDEAVRRDLQAAFDATAYELAKEYGYLGSFSDWKSGLTCGIAGKGEDLIRSVTFACQELGPELRYVGGPNYAKPYAYRCANCGQAMDGIYPSDVIESIVIHFGAPEREAVSAYMHTVSAYMHTLTAPNPVSHD